MESIHIVGIGGLPRSGKDTLAEIFIESGYFGVSLGDIVRDVSRVRHAEKPDPISVANMTETSNHLRQEKGADFALKEAIERFRKASIEKDYAGLVVFSVRAPIEVDFILQHGGELIWVEASDSVRHERAMQHLREGEAPVTLAQFKQQEDLQWQPQTGVDAQIQMNIAYVKGKATKILINNENNLPQFQANAHALMAEMAI